MQRAWNRIELAANRTNADFREHQKPTQEVSRGPEFAF